MKTSERLIDEWEHKGWTVTIEENANRTVQERFSCEVYENVGKEPLPRGLGYVCGYGATRTAAIVDAELKLTYAEAESSG
jgi:hypothetical protein